MTSGRHVRETYQAGEGVSVIGTATDLATKMMLGGLPVVIGVLRVLQHNLNPGQILIVSYEGNCT